MDYEAIDREASSSVVTCEHNGTRFYLTDDGTASDILARARRFRWSDEAALAAREANNDRAWRDGFHWLDSLLIAELNNAAGSKA